MKNKGFTLAELLGVITVLGIIAIITVPLVTSTIKDSKQKAYEKQVDAIETAAKQWGLENVDSLPVENSKEYVFLDTLINSGKIQNTSIINPKTSEKMTGCVVITYNSEYNQYEYKYEEVCIKSISFAEDSWDTIIAAVKAGKLDKYKVGDTKEIKLNGFTNTESNSNGLYTVRIANTSTPEECNQAGFSQTACGFVIEFVDIITGYNMNSTDTNVGGWPASSMRTYVNDTIYNALPPELKANIINTKVVSSHGSSDSANFTSTDKLYLLSTKEVWGKEETSNIVSSDSAEAETRQLDYYKNLGVTTSNYSGAIKKGANSWWWLRSANFHDNYRFYSVNPSGNWHDCHATHDDGLAAAFRLSE